MIVSDDVYSEYFIVDKVIKELPFVTLIWFESKPEMGPLKSAVSSPQHGFGGVLVGFEEHVKVVSVDVVVDGDDVPLRFLFGPALLLHCPQHGLVVDDVLRGCLKGKVMRFLAKCLNRLFVEVSHPNRLERRGNLSNQGKGKSEVIPKLISKWDGIEQCYLLGHEVTVDGQAANLAFDPKSAQAFLNESSPFKSRGATPARTTTSSITPTVERGGTWLAQNELSAFAGEVGVLVL